jgi:predicted ATPase with chaperone activity
MTGGAIFLYGPTGNGKTSLALRLKRLFSDTVYIPYSVEVSTQILSIFDPAVHQREEQPADIDPRWVRCRRPFVVVGGEMRAEMLEPHVDPVTRLCDAPLQMKANNGVLVIDDFGRQKMQPRELLNRWIVPMDRKVDHMSLWSGVHFEVPFDLLLVFATNLDLNSLAEEAFIRRIKNKVKVDAVSPDIFREIFRRLCEERGVAFDYETAEYARRRCEDLSTTGLRACFPRDLLDTLAGFAAFEERQPTLAREDIDRALHVYFAR